MNAATLPLRSPPAWRQAVGFAWRTWRATTRRQWAAALLVGLVIALIVLPLLFDVRREVGWQPLPMTGFVVGPFLISIVMFLGWTLADAGSDARRSRRARLITALLAAGIVACLINLALSNALGTDALWARMAHAKGKAEKLFVLQLLADYLNVIAVAGVIYAVCEVGCRRRQTREAVEALVRNQVTLEHQLLESRLAAMQAQVEPRFLFDTLVDIEALYARDAPRAAENLDQLIAYLRAALPRLREAGSTIEAELDLVAAYLAVVTSLHSGRPRLQVALAEECRRARFYPMLLLPLIQRAVRHPSGHLPESIVIDVRRDAGRVVVGLRIALAGGCAEDPELARVRERLAGLYGAAATLDCVETGDGVPALTLRIPAASA